MSRKVDWERAARRDRVRAYDHESRNEAAPKRAAAALQRRRQAATKFAREHGLECFKCGHDDVVFAKTGSNARGLWAICTSCVTRRAA